MKEFPLKLFTDSGQYTEEASRLDTETSQAVIPIFKKWVGLGFSPRMISHVMLHAMFGTELEEMFDVIFENHTESQNEKKTS